jgi:hypothetical protein
MRQINMGALGESMHAGVSAPGSVDSDAMTGDLLKAEFQFVLNSVSMSLALPARVRAAVIGND